MEKIIIKRTLKQLVFALSGAIPFIYLGIQLTFYSSNYNNPFLAKIIGIANLVFWLGLLLWALYKYMFQNRMLIIDNNGIINNTDGTKNQLIKWNNVQAVKSLKPEYPHLIALILENNTSIIMDKSQQKNKLKYGYPLIINIRKISTGKTPLENLISVELSKRLTEPRI